MNGPSNLDTTSVTGVGVLGVLIISIVGTGVQAARGADWPSWRGPNGDFTSSTKGLAESWPESGPPKLWERNLGPGYSGIAVVGDRLYTMYRDKNKDVVVALDAASGKIVWEHRYEAPPLANQSLDFGTGPNSTPLVFGDRVITVGFTGEVQCLRCDDGTLLWSLSLTEDFGGKVQEFGYAASPMRYKDHVIFLVGGEKHGTVAINPADGAAAWKGEPIDISYATPVFIDVEGQDQMVAMTSTEVVGLSPIDGRVLWRHPCANRYKNNATDPIWHADKKLLWVSTQLDGGTRTLRLTRTGGKTAVEEVWFNDKIKIFHWNAVRISDHIYGSIGDKVTLIAGIDMRTGDVKWRERGFHKAQCVLADGKLIFLDENGVLTLARVSPEGLDIRSKVQLTSKVSWTVPTLVNQTLFVRDQKMIMALDVGKNPG